MDDQTKEAIEDAVCEGDAEALADVMREAGAYAVIEEGPDDGCSPVLKTASGFAFWYEDDIDGQWIRRSSPIDIDPVSDEVVIDEAEKRIGYVDRGDAPELDDELQDATDQMAAALGGFLSE